MFVLVHLGVEFGFVNHVNLVIQNLADHVKDAAAGAEANSEELEAHSHLDFPGLEVELRAAFITFSVGRDHLEILLNSLSNRLKPGFRIPSFLTEAASGMETWPEVALMTSGQKKECKCTHLAEV